jgi:hypothetical protein
MKIFLSGYYPSSCFYLKHNVLEIGFCLLLQVKPAQLGLVDRATPYFRNFGSISSFVFKVHGSKLLPMVKVQLSLYLNN